VLKKLFWQFSLNHYWGPQLCYLYRGAKLNNVCEFLSVNRECLPLLFKLYEIWSVDLRNIMKIIATSCTKFDFGWGSAPDPAGGAYSTTDLLAGFKGPLRGRDGERKGEGWGGRAQRREE